MSATGEAGSDQLLDFFSSTPTPPAPTEGQELKVGQRNTRTTHVEQRGGARNPTHHARTPQSTKDEIDGLNLCDWWKDSGGSWDSVS